jgi:hypothetical protein
LGRFLPQDTYPLNFNNPVELNRYVYAGNNPINAMDPTGRFADAAGTYIPSAQNTARIATIGFIVAFVIGVVVIGTIHRLVGTQERTGAWQDILALEQSESNLAPGGDPNTNPTVYPPPWQVTPSWPTPQPSPEDDDDCDAPPWTDWIPPYEITGDAIRPIHHIATDKYTERDPYWTPLFAAIFAEANMDLQDHWNLIGLAGHWGPHNAAYHQYVFEELLDATDGLKCNPYRHALQRRLWLFKKELMTPNSYIRQLLGLRP